MITLVQPDIEAYAKTKSEPEGKLLEELVRETQEKMELPQMLCGQIEGRFLKLVAQISGAKRVLEIGMFTGYSALSLAEGLPEDGELVTLDIDPKAVEIASRYFARSEYGKKITIKQGPALKSIEELKGPFDLVFIDADKENYANYYEAVMPKLKAGGIILIDNVLWGGRVLDPQDQTDKAICALNDLLAKDKRVSCVLLPFRDGVFFIRKK